jgi:uncharacterized protein YuzB (UPF0349 family)
MPQIEVLFCRENLRFKGRAGWDELVAKADPRLRLQETRCIIACGECAEQFIARVNGQLVVSDTAEGLSKEVFRLAEEIEPGR